MAEVSKKKLIEKLKSPPKNPNKGGARPGAGRKKGGKNKDTLAKEVIYAQYRQRVMKAADKLFNAQFSLAQGVQYVYRIDEQEIGNGNTKKTHVLVTDPEEIKELLDEHEGGDGEVNGAYYYITAKDPDTRAIDSMLDRTFGKAIQGVEMSGKNGEDLPSTIINLNNFTKAAIQQLTDNDVLKNLNELANNQ